MEDLNDLVLFARVVEHKGFSAASRQLDVPKSRLSRRVAALEEQLGARLLQRTSRRLTVTPVGELFYERCRAVIAASESARDVVREQVGVPVGTVRLSCPITLAQIWLTPQLPRFMRAYPMVRIALAATNRRIDVVEEGFDVALRARRPPFEDSSLVVRRLGRTTDILVASPDLIASLKPPGPLRDLSHWPTLSLPSAGERATWSLVRGSETIEARIDPRLVSDDMFALRRAALDGVGVALLPRLVCEDELRSGHLRHVMPEWSSPPSEIQAAFPTRRGMLPAVRALIDFLAQNPPDAGHLAA